MGFAVRHVVNTDVDSFWKLHFDPEVARALISRLGNLGEFEILEDRIDADGVRHRKVEMRSKVEMPAFVRKLVGDGSYTEFGRWDPRLKRYSAECIPKVNGDKYRTRCEIIAHPVNDGLACEREIVTENSVKVLGIRALVENMLEKAQRDSHQQSADFINEWIRNNVG